MDIKVEKTEIDDVIIVRPGYYRDDRGFFSEIFREDVFRAAGLPDSFVQLNHSGSVKHVVRGLHFQWAPPMGKLMRVTEGVAFLVAVDIRKDSDSRGRWVGRTVSKDDRTMIWAPAGFARGFCVLSEWAEIQYLCTGVYNAHGESGIRWNDPEIGIQWPVSTPIVSPKDATAQTLREWLARPESDNFLRL